MRKPNFAFLTVVLFGLLTVSNTTSVSCQTYLGNLAMTYLINKTKAQAQLAPYLVMSGKSIDDLGFPQSCEEQLKDANYYTAEVLAPTNNNYDITTYFGFCFNEACSAQDLNTYNRLTSVETLVQLINNYTAIPIAGNATLKFVQPNLQAQSSIGSIIGLVVFGMMVGLASLFTVTNAFKSENERDSRDRQRYTFDDGDSASHLDKTTFIERMSFQYKFDQYLGGESEKSTKIVSFSVFKLFALPMIILGQEFYYRNFGANNYFAFESEIYESFYSKVATFAVYLPDVLFFISAYLLTAKALSFDSFGPKQAASVLFRKFLRLYPLYLAVLVIYWLISPSLHSGPVWYVYTNQAQTCNSYWWSSLILINNWFHSKCFTGGWFIEAEFQLILLAIVILLIRDKFRKVGLITYAVLLVLAFVLTFVFSPGMPASLESTLNPKLQRYLTATYSHQLFYLFGMGVALLRNNQSLSEKIEQLFERRRSVDIGLALASLSVCFLILMRPSIWTTASGFEFTLSRIGVSLAFFGFFAGGIWKNSDNQNATHLHKIAHYTYPMMLISTVICLSSVWSGGSFDYLSGLGLLNLLVPELLLSIGAGLLIGLIVEPRLKKV